RAPCSARIPAMGRPLAWVQAWKAATSCAWLISPVCSASRPNSKFRSAVVATMGGASGRAGGGGGRSAPAIGGLRPGHRPDEWDYPIRDDGVQPPAPADRPSELAAIRRLLVVVGPNPAVTTGRGKGVRQAGDPAPRSGSARILDCRRTIGRARGDR